MAAIPKTMTRSEYNRSYYQKNKERLLQYQKEYYESHKDECDARTRAYQRSDKYKARYKTEVAPRVAEKKLRRMGVPEDQIPKIVSTTTCRVCKIPVEGHSKHLDHNHLTGKFRGVLCQKCNHILGLAHEDPGILIALARYLMPPISGGAQTVGTGGGPASRQYSGNLYKILRKEDFERGLVYTADYIKLEQELNEIFNRISFSDPTVTGANACGNFGGAAMVGAFTTPATTGTTAVINHTLGRVPVGWFSIGPAVKNGQNVTWAFVSSDTNNLLLKLVHSEDTSVVTALVIY